MKIKLLSASSCALAVAGSFLLGLMGCGSAGIMGTGASPSANSAPAILTVTDAPLGNILSAMVTVSSVTVNPSGSGTPVSLLTSPTTVELSGLNGIQEPLEIGALPMGTYSSISVAISGVSVTYVDSTGKTITASATVASPTVNIPLNPALSVSSTAGVDLHLAVDLGSSFSISGSTVTFAPVVTAAYGQIDSEDQGQRLIHVSGPLVSISSTSLVVQSADSGRQFTFTVNSSTHFPNSMNATSIPAGTIVQVKGEAQPDGTFLALSVAIESGEANDGQDGEQSGDQDENQNNGGKGIVTAVTESNGVLTSFTFVPREDFGDVNSSSPLTAMVSSTTAFVVPTDALSAGVPANSFTAASLFAGESVFVTGAMTTMGTLNATQVTLSGEGTKGVLTAMPQGSGSDLNFTITLPSMSFLTTYTGMTSLNVVTNQATDFGDGLTAATLAADPAGTSLEVHGYLIMTGPKTYVLYADEVNTMLTDSQED